MEVIELETKIEKGIQSVNRAIQILNCFENNEELGVTEISKLMELHKSTVFGLISTLEMNKLLKKMKLRVNIDWELSCLGLELKLIQI